MNAVGYNYEYIGLGARAQTFDAKIEMNTAGPVGLSENRSWRCETVDVRKDIIHQLKLH